MNCLCEIPGKGFVCDLEMCNSQWEFLIMHKPSYGHNHTYHFISHRLRASCSWAENSIVIEFECASTVELCNLNGFHFIFLQHYFRCSWMLQINSAYLSKSTAVTSDIETYETNDIWTQQTAITHTNTPSVKCHFW